MPYIPYEHRAMLQPKSDVVAETPGDLNFQFTCLALDYLEVHGAQYRTLNDIIGALEGAKLEFYKRMVQPYEEVKRMENGDVY